MQKKQELREEEKGSFQCEYVTWPGYLERVAKISNQIKDKKHKFNVFVDEWFISKTQKLSAAVVA